MISDDYDYIGQVVLSGANVTNGMAQLVAYCEQEQPDPRWERLLRLDYAASVSQLADWLTDVLTTEPPGADINGYWFGLYNPMLDDGGDGCQLYISGSTTYTPHDRTGDWATWEADSYKPDKRYADPTMLTILFRMTSPLVPGSINSEVGEYVLCLGYAALAVAYLCQTLPPAVWLGDRDERAVALGYDSGDCWVLGTMLRSGWQIDHNAV